MKDLTKADVLAAQDLKREAVDVPEWGGRVYLTELTAAERVAWEKRISGLDDTKPLEVLTSLLVVTVCDRQGERLFDEADVPELAKRSAAVLLRLQKQALELNRLTDDDIEGLAKKSERGRSGDSASGSPSPLGARIPVGSEPTGDTPSPDSPAAT